MLASVGAVLQPWQPNDMVLRDIDAAEFTEHILPALQRSARPPGGSGRNQAGLPRAHRRAGAHDHHRGDRSARLVRPRRASCPSTGAPSRSTTSSGRWSPGATKLLLIDGTYLSLAQPAFEQLRQLIEEAKPLQEWETGLRISRYQAGLWEELEELAENTVQATAWRDSVTGPAGARGRGARPRRPPSLHGDPAPVPVGRIRLAGLPLAAPAGRHPGRRHGAGQDAADPRADPARARIRTPGRRAVPRRRAHLRGVQLGRRRRTRFAPGPARRRRSPTPQAARGTTAGGGAAAARTSSSPRTPCSGSISTAYRAHGLGRD